MKAIKMQRPHLVSLVRLRGLAALMVVIGHSFHVTSINAAQHLYNPVYLFVASSTVIFVLIAGVLFRMRTIPQLLQGQTDAKTILRKRWAELSGIYLTVGLFLALVVSIKEGLRDGANPVLDFVRMMLNGSMAHSYWYVTFFLLLMALTPAHRWFCQRRNSTKIGLIISGAIISSFVHRPDSSIALGAVHSVMYYIPVFWLGLALGAHWKALLQWMRGKEMVALCAVIAIIAVQTTIGQNEAYLNYPGERWGKVDFFLVQKVIFALCFLSVFDRTQHLKMPVLDWISKHSLIIFFMHSPVLILIMWVPHLSGLYFPELALTTIVMIFGGVQLYKSLVQVFGRLPDHIRVFGRVVTGQRTVELPR
jgi:hypothetical protein